MRYGFTTGSCAAAAAKAAAYMLLTGREKTEITIETPKGIPYTAKIRNICRKEQEVSCAVEKDGGDDPDITTGALICAKVSFAEITDRKAREEPGRKNGTGHAPEQAQVVIDGGIGVGRVTKPGLDQPVGNAAINHVPREMIEREVLQVCQVLDYRGILSVEISVPEGEKLAEKTYSIEVLASGGRISIVATAVCASYEHTGYSGYDPRGTAATAGTGERRCGDLSGQLRTGFSEKIPITMIWIKV